MLTALGSNWLNIDMQIRCKTGSVREELPNLGLQGEQWAHQKLPETYTQACYNLPLCCIRKQNRCLCTTFPCLQFSVPKVIILYCLRPPPYQCCWEGKFSELFLVSFYFFYGWYLAAAVLTAINILFFVAPFPLGLRPAVFRKIQIREPHPPVTLAEGSCPVGYCLNNLGWGWGQIIDLVNFRNFLRLACWVYFLNILSLLPQS